MVRIIIVLFFLSSLAKGQTVNGIVFNDLNKNSTHDKNEPGIAGVAVSNQVTVVTTTAEGKFTLDMKGSSGMVMISTPDGYKAASYWKRISSGDVSFPLQKTSTTTSFTFIHASDTHISEKSVDRMDKFRAIVEKEKPDFVLVTGDLIRDALRVPEDEARRYYELYVSNIAKFTSPVWSVPGNHEIFGIERHLSLVSTSHPMYGKKMYHHYLGPNYYSFNYGGIHFIGLDDVDYDDTWYYGHIDSTQFEWLKKDLSVVPANMPVVTFKHIPMFSGGLSMTTFEESGPGRTLERVNGQLQFRHTVANSHDLVELLTTHPYPVSLAGHYHARMSFRYESTGQNIRFEQTAAVVGNGGEGKVVMKSGVMKYSVTNGTIDQGRFIPLD
jgi:predicted MPP superfamily phosphohydrolase